MRLQTIATALAVLTTMPAFAGINLLTDDEAATQALSWNAPSGCSGVPGYFVVGKSGKFYLGVGGQVKTTIGADFGHPIDDPDEFITSAIPMGDMNGNGAKFNISARQTSFFLNMVAMPESKDKVGAYVGFNFIDPNYKPTLVYAYLRWRGLQAGYDYNLFSDPASNPGMIDYEGANSILSLGAASLRWTQKFDAAGKWTGAIGLEMPRASFTDADLLGHKRTSYVSQRVPDIPLAVEYSWAEGSHVRLAGVVRNLYSRNLIENKNIDRLGWGLHLSYVGEILPRLTGYASGWYGRGIASFCEDLSDGGLDLVPTADGRSVEAIKAWGAYAALQYSFNEKWSILGCYSHVRTYADKYDGGAVAWGDQYRYGQYVAANLCYNINDHFSTGIEYIWGRRVNNNGEKAANNRVQAAFTFNF